MYKNLLFTVGTNEPPIENGVDIGSNPTGIEDDSDSGEEWLNELPGEDEETAEYAQNSANDLEEYKASGSFIIIS